MVAWQAGQEALGPIEGVPWGPIVNLGAMSNLCWARELGGCGGGMTGEHPVSRAFFKTTGIRTASWDKPAHKTIGINSFTLKTLCENHNNGLSELDALGGRYSEALRKVLAMMAGGTIVNKPILHKWPGLLLERWFLKCMINLLIRDGKGMRWSNGAPPDTPPLEVVRAVFGLAPVTYPVGLWDVHIVGRNAVPENQFNCLLTCKQDGTFVAARMECHTLFYLFWMAEEPPEFERDAMIIRADTSDITKPLKLYDDHPDHLVTYHNPAGLFKTPTLHVEFQYEWPEPPRRLERQYPSASAQVPEQG